MAAVLVVYYSHSGHTKAAAEAIASRLEADLHEIRATTRSPSGLIGFFWAGKDSWQGRSWPIEASTEDVASYDLVVLCAPVWAGRLAPPARTWLQKEQSQIQALAVCATVGGTKAARLFADVEALVPLPLVARAIITDSDRKWGEGAEIIRGFVRELQTSR